MKTRLLWQGFCGLLVWCLLPGISTAAPDVDKALVRFEQRLGEPLPLTARFRDDLGRPCTLGDFFHGKPVVLYFGYARCPMLCSVVADGMVTTLRRLRWTVGREFEVVTISIDPTETLHESRSRQQSAVRRYGREEADRGWRALTGTEANIRAVADAAGFHYVYDPKSQQYVHATGFLVATPQGKISRYFLGVDFNGDDVVAALKRAGRGGTGLSVYNLLILCCRGGLITGRYGRLIWNVLWVAVLLTVAGLGSGVGWMLWQERRGRRPTAIGEEAQ